VRARGNKRLAAVPRDFDESQLEEIYARANPTAANAMTFYRAIGGTAVDEALGLINKSPNHYRAVKGDFAVDGGFYVFAEKENAEHVRGGLCPRVVTWLTQSQGRRRETSNEDGNQDRSPYIVVDPSRRSQAEALGYSRRRVENGMRCEITVIRSRLTR
jgi:hypothetical protein